MKFAQPMWLFGALFALVVGGLFVLGGLGIARATRRFGDVDRILDGDLDGLMQSWLVWRKTGKLAGDGRDESAD